MGKVEPRNVTPILSAIRNLLLGRSHTSPLRFGDYYSPRTQPPPEVPGGPAHVLSNNYYYSRDGRRDVAPPRILADNTSRKQIGAGTSLNEKGALSAGTPKTPGKQWDWD
ncbi:NADH dehydrogenase (ubiquinone) 1 alpha subcomplex [Nesidiocoris tenuis]|uniref:NADH dehydrogenase [ubiquinone] 1 alpha subcomplex subunit 7 n=1 Tax=Nesidiocoris tenuis TaxID=355587 RepID=A0ABN7AJ88_9HEMI|nr:NADH dehydrogenase (ubiquinone) 1 alpha subcomplex [Nesidiocoris tenuis]